MCARAIHHVTRRRNLPFIPVDCGAIPGHLFENEVFGHARGAFTDAQREQKGLVAMADGGTLFLDEVDMLPLPVQSKLLRFLQEHTYKPLGCDRFLRSDVRVVAASNRDMEGLTAAGQFRSDLYFRLNVLRLELPPLRQRPADIELLARHFVNALADAGPGPKILSPGAIRKLSAYDWPGNVRELYNVVHRAVVFAADTQILPCDIATSAPAPPEEARGCFHDARARAIESFERFYVAQLLEKHAGNVTQAAREAGKERRSFGRLVKKYAMRSGTAQARQAS
jgi:two-component system response regulator GlrR